MSRLLIYLTFLLIGGLSSCTDHRIPAVTPGSTTTRLRVKTITQDLPNNIAKVSAFKYDAQNRLSSILAYQTPDSTVSDIQYSTYQYDGQNRLTGLRREAVRYPRGSGSNRVEEYVYTYNGAGQLAGINYINGFSLTFAYNGSNQLMSSYRVSYSGLSLLGRDFFTFTGRNLTSLRSNINLPTRGSGPEGTSITETTYMHDEKANPFYGVFVIPDPLSGFINLQFGPGSVQTYFGGIGNALTLSQNNVLTEVSNNNSTFAGTSQSNTVSSTYQYQYNAASLPTVRTKTTTSTSPGSTTTVETLRFEYESY